LSWREGGLTFKQTLTLFIHAQKREEKSMMFQARLHGFRIPDDKLVVQTEVTDRAPDDFVFQDPKEYENLSNEEREKLTKKMMVMHKSWAEKKTPFRSENG